MHFIAKQVKGGNKIDCPITFDHSDRISGLFLSSCIRFYKFEQDYSYEKLKEMFPTLSRIEILKRKEELYSNSDSFNVKDGKIYLNSYGSNEKGKGYNFNNGIVIVKSKNFMDVIEKERLDTYLEEFGFDREIKDEIFSEETIEIKRNPNKKLSYNIGMPNKVNKNGIRKL